MHPKRLFLLLVFIGCCLLAKASAANLDSLYARAFRLSITNRDSAEILSAQLLQQSMEEGNFEFAGKAAYLIGYVNDKKKLPLIARMRYVESLAYLRKARLTDRELELTVLVRLGIVNRLSGRNPDAIKFYEEALELCGGCKMESMIQYNIGYTLYTIKEYEKAILKLSEAHALSVKQGVYVRANNCLNYIGLCNHHLGEYAVARDYYNQILSSEVSLGDNYLKFAGWALHNTAFTYFDEGLHDKALDYYLQALDVERQLADSSQQFVTLMDLGELMMVKADTQQAVEYLEQAAALFHLKMPDAESFKVFELLDRATYGRDQEKNRQHMQRVIDEWGKRVTQLAAETELQQSQVLESLTWHNEIETARLRVYWVASLIALAIITLLAFFYYKRRQKRKHREIVRLISEI